MKNKSTLTNSPTLTEYSEISDISTNTLINIEENAVELNTLKDKKKDVQKNNIKNGLKKLSFLLPSKKTIKLCLLCVGWYCTSAMHSNYQKKVLKLYNHPVTITYIQFLGIAIYSIISHLLHFSHLKPISKNIIKQTLPLGLFQICGHLLNSFALSLVSVSFVQTIKALSPLFIIGIYTIFFHISYSKQTYFSLLPLTFGVMLVCVNKSSFNLIGFICALFSTIVFALQNIFTKKVLSGNKSKSGKLDKFNVLFYFSLQAFILLTPWWFSLEGYKLFSRNTEKNQDMTTTTTDSSTLLINILINSLANFLQSFFAFTLINYVSPVTYSIAGLVKRIFVIMVSLIFFGDHVSTLQSVGIIITFIGLFLYNNAKNSSTPTPTTTTPSNLSSKTDNENTIEINIPLIDKKLSHINNTDSNSNNSLHKSFSLSSIFSNTKSKSLLPFNNKELEGKEK